MSKKGHLKSVKLVSERMQCCLTDKLELHKKGRTIQPIQRLEWLVEICEG